MILAGLWKTLEASPVGAFVAGSEWAFPTIESIHVIAIVTVVGSIAVMDLRLLGVASRSSAVTAMARDTLPFTWGAFVIAVIAGSLLFVSKATTYVANPYFQVKMICLVLAGLNMAVFHASTTWRRVNDWDVDTAVPLAGKICAGLSLFFWIFVVFFGRLVGFTLGIIY
ncbi:MAG: DUF6644 family protein [Janthinobacterium lividum]